jgi:hypothetical protein
LTYGVPPNDFANSTYGPVKISELMKGTACPDLGSYEIYVMNHEEAKQVYEEIQKASEPWMASYKSIIPVAVPR